MDTRSTFKSMRKGLLVLLGAGLLVVPGCVTEEPEGGFFDPAEDVAAESVGSVKQAMVASLCADPSTATITGTAGDDYILGTPGNDIIFALGGNDIVEGFGGDDIICGGPGVDNLRGGDGNDQVEGGSGYNFLYGNAGDDIVIGGDDGNEMQGNAGNDDLDGGAGADTIYGGDDDDTLAGGAGNDYMSGGSGDDCMDGGAGNDNVNGEAGDDRLNGGADPDFINCGAGNDTHESTTSDGVSNCEVAGNVDCDISCACNTPNSYFEAFVTGNIPYSSGLTCFNSSSTSLVVNFSGGGIAAGGEAGSSGSGNWACESGGPGYPGNVGFVTGLTEAEARHCADLVRDQLVAQGVNPNAQCNPW